MLLVDFFYITNLMIKYRKPNIVLPLNIPKYLDPYLEEGEEIIDLIMETIIPAFDLRWLIITNIRVILVTYKWFQYEFHDVRYDGIDMQFTEGLFYDSLRVKSMTDDYRANFYAFARNRTREFMQEIEDEKESFMLSKKKHEKEIEHEVTEQLILEGELPMDQDEGHREKLEKEKKSKEESESNTGESQECTPINTLRQLDGLREQGVITEEEYQKKKKELLDRI